MAACDPPQDFFQKDCWAHHPKPYQVSLHSEACKPGVYPSAGTAEWTVTWPASLLYYWRCWPQEAYDVACPCRSS